MKKKIIQASVSGGSPEEEEVLSKGTVPVESFDSALAELVDDLLDTMEGQPLCVGLAAPQIGSEARVAVVTVGGEPLALVNPVVVNAWGKKDRKRESCMSLFGWTAEVERRDKVSIRFQTVAGAVEERTFERFEARIVQHELDHLDGTLYRDRATGDLQPTDLFDGHSPDG